jgi:hypothetical protein
VSKRVPTAVRLPLLVALPLLAAALVAAALTGVRPTPASAGTTYTFPDHWHAWPAFDPAAYGAVNGISTLANMVPADYNHDGSVDIGFMTDTGQWVIDYYRAGTTGERGAQYRFDPTPIAWNNGYGGSAVRAAPGDYDGDGYPDLAILNTDGKLYWSLSGSLPAAYKPYNQANPPYWTCTSTTCRSGFAAPSTITSMLVADYDGDGKADFAYQAGSTVVIDYSNAAIGRKTYSLSITSPVLMTEDVNGDGVADLVSMDNVGTVRVRRGVSGGAPANLTTWDETYANSYGGSTAVKLVPGDYDGDGCGDLSIVTSTGTWYVALRNVCSNSGVFGGWTASAAGFGAGTSGSAGARYFALNIDKIVNSNKAADLVEVTPTSNRWLVSLSTNPAVTPPVFSAKSTFADSGWAGNVTQNAFVGKFDSDTKADIGFMSDSGTLEVDQSSTGWQAPSIAWANGYGGTGTIEMPADYDGDGTTDFATLAPVGTGSTLYWALSSQQAAGTVPYNQAHPVGWTCAGSLPCPTGLAAPSTVAKAFPGDFDGDGKADVAYMTTASPPVLFVRYSSTGATRSWTLSWTAPQFSVADYNGDGKADFGVLDATGDWRIAYGSATIPTTLTWEDHANSYGDSRLVTAVGADYNGDGAADISVVDGAGNWYVANRSGGTYGGWSTITGGFLQPGTNHYVAADTDGDGKADKTVWTKFAYNASSPWTGDPAKTSQTRWYLDGSNTTRTSHFAHWQGEGLLGAILDDSEEYEPVSNPTGTGALGRDDFVHIEYMQASYATCYDPPTGCTRRMHYGGLGSSFPADTTFLRNRIQKAVDNGKKVVIDFSSAWLQYAPSDRNAADLPALMDRLKSDICPNNVCYAGMWVELMDEPYNHGATEKDVNWQAYQLRQRFPVSSGVSLLFVDGSESSFAPGGEKGPNNPANNCNTTNPTPNVSVWCWAYTDPDVDSEVPSGYAYAIPPDVDYVAFDAYPTTNNGYSPAHNDFKDTFNALRSLTTKPFISFTSTWWLCPASGGVPTCTTSTFPLTADACTSAYETLESIASCPAEDLFRYTDMVNDDPQNVGWGNFLYGRLPNWVMTTNPEGVIDTNEPFGINGLRSDQRATFERVLRSMMWAVGRT